MKEVQNRLAEHGLNVELSPAARDWLAKVGYDPNFGARPLRRALQKHVESPLSLRLLAGEFSSGQTVLVDVDESKNELVFTTLVAIPAKGVRKETSSVQE
jgi:ATP-dependent Clp protease ATP-binding subunit ClpC